MFKMFLHLLYIVLNKNVYNGNDQNLKQKQLILTKQYSVTLKTAKLLFSCKWIIYEFFFLDIKNKYKKVDWNK